MNIIVDCMGGDNAPLCNIYGSILSLRVFEDLNVTLVGKKDIIENILKSYVYDRSRVRVVNTNSLILDEDKPSEVIRTKKDSSLFVSLEMLKYDEYDAFISCSNTGAFLAGGLFILGRLDGIERPALAPIIKTGKNATLLLDVGANVDCKIHNFLEWAKLASVLYKLIFNEDRPKVYLLNIGKEEEKGNSLTKKAFFYLKESQEINFLGNIEAREILNGESNIILSDGFSGNIALKSMEGTFKSVLDTIKSEVNTSFKYKLAANILKPVFKNISKKFDYHQYGGAILLGTKKICIKAHGDSNELSIKNAISLGYDLYKKSFISEIKKVLKK